MAELLVFTADQWVCPVCRTRIRLCSNKDEPRHYGVLAAAVLEHCVDHRLIVEDWVNNAREEHRMAVFHFLIKRPASDDAPKIDGEMLDMARAVLGQIIELPGA